MAGKPSVRAFCLAVILLYLGGCASASDLLASQQPDLMQSIHSDLLAKFTQVEQPTETDVYVHHSGSIPFAGDCDDYQAAARYRLIDAGLTPVAVTGFMADGKFHVFTCAAQEKSVCLDPNYQHVQTLNTLRGVYRNISVYPLRSTE
jgi:predicted transglutaminase-like cysteine proteinase